MHLIMQGDFEELFDFLKLRWVSFNKDKTLKVFGVPEKSLMQYHQTATSAKYDIENMPAEQYRIREEEVISQKDYDNLLKGIVAPLDQDSQAFDFANSRSISNDPNADDSGSITVEDGFEDGAGVVDDDSMLDCMKGSVLAFKNETEGSAASTAGSKEPTLADFKMIIVLGKGTFGKVFLSEFSFNKQLYAIKVIRKDVLIEYNQIKNTKLEKDIMFKC